MITCNADNQRIFDEQLDRCGAEYFDYYLLHTLGVKNYAITLKYSGFEFMKKMKAEGKAQEARHYHGAGQRRCACKRTRGR